MTPRAACIGWSATCGGAPGCRAALPAPPSHGLLQEKLEALQVQLQVQLQAQLRA